MFEMSNIPKIRHIRKFENSKKPKNIFIIIPKMEYPIRTFDSFTFWDDFLVFTGPESWMAGWQASWVAG